MTYKCDYCEKDQIYVWESIWLGVVLHKHYFHLFMSWSNSRYYLSICLGKAEENYKKPKPAQLIYPAEIWLWDLLNMKQEF
jgi:hypothetical protein